MSLDITMKPAEPVKERFSSATLSTYSGAKMRFIDSSEIEAHQRNRVKISCLKDGEDFYSSWFWDAKDLRELAKACGTIADILDKQNK